MNDKFKMMIQRVIGPGLLAACMAAFMLPLLRLDLGDTIYQPTGFRILFSSLVYQGQLVQYPLLLKLIMLGIILTLVAAVLLSIVRKPGPAAAAACIATGLTLLTLLAAGSLGKDLTTIGASQTVLSIQSGYIVLIVMPFLAALIILWSRGGEDFARVLFLTCAAVSVVSVALITIYMIIGGLPAILEIGPLQFLFSTVWRPTDPTNPQFGILNMILATFAGTGGSILVGVPIGLLTAVFLAEIAPPRLAKLIRPAVELLAGIPSVIIGFFGLQILVPLVQRVFNLPTGMTLFSVIIVLTIMILPTIISTAETGLRAVPETYREASLAIGATRIETIFKVLIPAARSAILSGVILGVGRAIGETMAIAMVAGNIPNLPELFTAVKPMTVGISSEMSYSTGLHQQALFSIGLMLFLFIMIVNLAFNWISRRGVQLDAK